jgi:hypothetical protein
MILSRRFFVWSDVVVRRWLVRHPSFLVKVVESRGVCSDDCLWERARLWSVVPGWPCIGIPLTGHGLLRGGRDVVEMSRGYLGVVGKGADFRARTEPAPAFGLFVQWDPAVFGGGDHAPLARARIGERDLGRVASVLRAVTRDDVPHDALVASVADLLRMLSAQGVFSSATNVDLAPPPPRLARIGRAIDGALSRSGSRPMIVDLTRALDCSERQVRYLVSEYAGAYALQGATEWRTLVATWTTYLAGLLMTARGATTEGVSSVLGYGSPNAFCHALTNAGLPPPGELRRIVAGLG